MWRWIFGSLCPVNPMYRILPAFCAAVNGLHRATGAEDLLRIGVANHFVHLHKIDVIRAEPPEALVYLLRRRVLVRPSIFVIRKDLLTIAAVRQRLSHPVFAAAVVIIPAIVHELMPLSTAVLDNLRSGSAHL